MNYTSTRNHSVKVSAAHAIATGISPDGGLYVPETIPAIAPGLVIPLQYSAPKNTGRNAAAQISKKRLVPSATTLPGSEYAITKANMIAIRIPTLEMLT